VPGLAPLREVSRISWHALRAVSRDLPGRR